MAHVERTE